MNLFLKTERVHFLNNLENLNPITMGLGYGDIRIMIF